MMSRDIHFDISPPAYTSSARDYFDRDGFSKTITVLGARVLAEKTHRFLKAPELRNTLMIMPRRRTVVTNLPTFDGDRLVLLRIGKESEISAEAKQFLDQEAKGLLEYELKLDYNYWSLEDCLHAYLPEELRAGAPSGFSVMGHIGHVNLTEEYLPYKRVIGQLILDKNKSIQTVVNKLDIIDNQFRLFKMELIAGEPNFVVQHREADCQFTFNFTRVYWNSRLHHEHSRIVSLFKPEEVVADVFAGVGPFVVPAAKKGCGVLANDLNPHSIKYLHKNVEDNKVTGLVRVSCEDGRDFIRRSVERAYDDPLPPYPGPKPSKQEEKELKRLRYLNANGTNIPLPAVINPHPPRRVISHFVMNLPESAIMFLDAFRGIFRDDYRAFREIYEEMPMIHCHCFTRELEFDKAEEDIRTRVTETLGHALPEETNVHMVRSVAPNKHMYCISFRLPREVAFMDQ